MFYRKIRNSVEFLSEYTAITILLSILMLSQPATLLSQGSETLLSGDVTHGGFGGPVLKMGQAAGESSLWVGGRGGWIINFSDNHAIALGGGGYGLSTSLETEIGPNVGSDYRAENGYGGFELTYINSTNKLLHFTLSTLVGGGAVTYIDHGPLDLDEIEDPYFIVEPAAQAEVNITSFFRIAAGLSYQLTDGVNKQEYSDKDFSGLNGILTFKFGAF